MNYYRHHIGDYDSHTAHLSWLEDCAYFRLLRLYYRTERPIPADLVQACRLVRAASKDERAAVEQVLHEFFDLREDGWHQKRCDEEIEADREFVEGQRAAANARWKGRKSQSVGIAAGMPPHMPPHAHGISDAIPPTPTPTPTPTPKREKSAARPDAERHALFVAFREAYPKTPCTGATWQAAEQHHANLLDDGEDPAVIHANAEAYARQVDVSGDRPRNPDRWLREGHWRGPFDIPVPRRLNGNHVETVDQPVRTWRPDPNEPDEEAERNRRLGLS